MLQHIALVSESASVSIDSLTIVAAAIQKQVSRDFAPLWQVEGTVSAFASVNQIPIGYWPVIIQDDVDSEEDGIHRTDSNRQPMALVRAGTNWSLTASHECLEMLADPSGDRLVAGNSVLPQQGRVQYLVEVCDPCESASCGYSVDGVLVSDFYTPQYFDPLPSPSVRYSFTGALPGPRAVLEGGYLSWLFPVTGHMWQLRVEDGHRRFSDIGRAPSAGALRAFADRSSTALRRRALSGPHRSELLLTGALGYPSDSDKNTFDEAKRAGAQLLRAEMVSRRAKRVRGESNARDDVATPNALSDVDMAGPVFGTFDGLVEAKWLPDGRRMVLINQFTFREAGGTVWTAPQGALIDGASIPSVFWGPAIGGPFEGKFRDASVSHDYECCVKQRPWRDVHRMFYRAARARGEEAWRAKLMYFAIYVFGPKWPVPFTASASSEQPLPPAPESYSEQDLLAAAAHIQAHPEITLEQIELLTPGRLRYLATSFALSLRERVLVDSSQLHRAERSEPCVETGSPGGAR